MKTKAGTSLYLNDADLKSRKKKVPRNPKIFAGLFAIMSLMLVVFGAQPLLNDGPVGNLNSPNEDSAYAFIDFTCGTPSQLGQGMNSKTGWHAALTRYPAFDESPRTWTLQEMASSGMSYVRYDGEGGEDITFVRDAGTERVPNSDAYNTLVDDRLQEPRTFASCFFGTPLIGISNLTLSVAATISAVTQQITVFAFSSNFVCPTNQDAEGCFNLIGVIGGDGSSSDTGIIGALTDSIYLPLLVIVAAVAAISLAIQGLMQRRLREAFFGFVWVIASTVLGLAFLLNPAMLANAPMAVSNSIGACVIGAFNGENCFTGGSSSGEIAEQDAICLSRVPGLSTEEQMELTVNGLSCSLWRAFILEPYSVGSFGMSYSELDTVIEPSQKITDAIESAGFEGSDFCINRYSSASAESMKGETLDLPNSQGQICNIAAYQMYLGVNADAGDSSPASLEDASGAETGWWKIILTTASDDDLWNEWSYSGSSALNKIGVSSLAVVTAFIGGIIILVIAVLAVMYYLISVILMALAPLFFLLAVHPTRGRKMFLGWTSQVISNILKYLASALFLIITVALYGAVLASSDNLGMTFLFVLILSLALFWYRGEVVNLLGRVEMGGEKMSNKFAEKVSEKAKGAGRFALGTAGGAVGGAIATGATRNVGEYFKNARAGAMDNVKRDLKRGRGFTAEAARSAERISNDNRQDLRAKAKGVETEAGIATSRADTLNEQASNARSDLDQMKADQNRDQGKIDNLQGKADVTSRVKEEVLIKMENDNPGFANAQRTLNELDDVRAEKRIATAAGDQDRVTELTSRESDLQDQYDDAASTLSTQDRERGERRYGHMVKAAQAEAGVKFSSGDQAQLTEARANMAAAEGLIESKAAELKALEDDARDASVQSAELSAKAASLAETSAAWRPGTTMSGRDVRKAEKRAEDAALAAGEIVRNKSGLDDPKLEAGPSDRPRDDFESAPPEPKDVPRPNEVGRRTGEPKPDDTQQDTSPSVEPRDPTTGPIPIVQQGDTRDESERRMDESRQEPTRVGDHEAKENAQREFNAQRFEAEAKRANEELSEAEKKEFSKLLENRETLTSKENQEVKARVEELRAAGEKEKANLIESLNGLNAVLPKEDSSSAPTPKDTPRDPEPKRDSTPPPAPEPKAPEPKRDESTAPSPAPGDTPKPSNDGGGNTAPASIPEDIDKRIEEKAREISEIANSRTRKEFEPLLRNEQMTQKQMSEMQDKIREFERNKLAGTRTTQELNELLEAHNARGQKTTESEASPKREEPKAKREEPIEEPKAKREEPIVEPKAKRGGIDDFAPPKINPQDPPRK